MRIWDYLIEQNPKIQQIRAESELIGEVRGKASGITAMQSAILRILQERFPLLAEKAGTDIEKIQSLEALGQLTVELSVARDEASAYRAIAAYLP